MKLLVMLFCPPSPAQGAVPKGNATKEFIESLHLKPGQVVYKCPKCCSIKPDRAHHCRYPDVPAGNLPAPSGSVCFLASFPPFFHYRSVHLPDDTCPPSEVDMLN